LYFARQNLAISVTDNNSTYRELELGTIISGKVLYLDYYAETPSFSKIFPTALKMINSLRINRSAIAELTPSPSSLSSSNNTATSTSSPTPTYTKGHHSETISSGSFSLPPGGAVKDFSFSVPSNAVNPRLIGTYSVTGGILPLIDVHLLDSIGSYIINEIRSSGQIVKSLSPGTYTLQFQNNAVFAGETKNVQVDFSLEYDVLTPSQ
jgi:hypothetical protein